MRCRMTRDDLATGIPARAADNASTGITSDATGATGTTGTTGLIRWLDTVCTQAPVQGHA